MVTQGSASPNGTRRTIDGTSDGTSDGAIDGAIDDNVCQQRTNTFPTDSPQSMAPSMLCAPGTTVSSCPLPDSWLPNATNGAHASRLFLHQTK